MSDKNEWLKNQLEKVDGKLDKLDTRLDNVDVTLAKQSIELENHIYRTSLAEANIEMLRNEVKPLQKKFDMISGGAKLIGYFAAGLGFFEMIIKALGFLHFL